MTTIQAMLDSLTEQMKEQECYKEYKRSLKEIKKDEQLYERLNEFRRQNVELHYKRKTLKEEARLEKEFHDFLQIDIIREFLYWEQETLKMLRFIHGQVDAALAVDYSFL